MGNDISNAAATLGRKGGSVKSERKAASSAANGRKGGRPRTGGAPTLAERVQIPEEIAKRLRELILGGGAQQRTRALQLLRNEVRRVLLGEELLNPNKPLPGGKTTQQVVDILRKEGLIG